MFHGVSGRENVVSNPHCSGLRSSKRCAGSGISSEAPAKLGYGILRARLSHEVHKEDEIAGTKKELHNFGVPTRTTCSSCPIDISRERPTISDNKMHRRLSKQRSISTDIGREEAWERKRDLYTMEELGAAHSSRIRAVGRSVSDCGERNWKESMAEPSPRTRTRSLTDEDLEELKGCIDLGFGFTYDESCELKGTLPALELYYAINRQYVDITNRCSSPASPLDGVSLDRTSSGGSTGSPKSDSWRISSPGDHPSQVKTRLRHWAQAVACSIKQGLSM